MPRYPVLTIAGERLFPMRYDELRAGEQREPVVALVPYHDSLEDALAAVQRYSDARLDPLRRHISGTSADPDATYEDKLANPTIFFRGQSNLALLDRPHALPPNGHRRPCRRDSRRVELEEERAGAIRHSLRGIGGRRAKRTAVARRGASLRCAEHARRLHLRPDGRRRLLAPALQRAGITRRSAVRCALRPRYGAAARHVRDDGVGDRSRWRT